MSLRLVKPVATVYSYAICNEMLRSTFYPWPLPFYRLSATGIETAGRTGRHFVLNQSNGSEPNPSGDSAGE